MYGWLHVVYACVLLVYIGMVVGGLVAGVKDNHSKLEMISSSSGGTSSRVFFGVLVINLQI